MYRTNFPDAPRPYANSLNRIHNGGIKEQLKSSWLTAIIGCAMFSAGMWFLFWNEGQAVQMARSLEEAMNAVVSVQYTTVPLDQNNGKLIHFNGPLHVGEPLTEPDYGVSVPAVKLKRRVQMYQWVEEEHTRELVPDDREFVDPSYSYSMEWKDKLIYSSSFYIKSGHHNPKEFPLKSTIYVNDDVRVGGFVFDSALKDKFTDFILVTSDERPERKDIKMHAGLYYHSQDVWNPDIGDIRVQFSYAGKAGDMVSVVGMQYGKEIRAYKTFSGEEILMLHSGRFTVEEIFLEEKSRNQMLTWAYRGLGWFIMFLGSNCLTNILRLIGFLFIEGMFREVLLYHRFHIVEDPTSTCNGGPQILDHVIEQCIKLNCSREVLRRSIHRRGGTWPTTRNELVIKYLKEFYSYVNSMDFYLKGLSMLQIVNNFNL